MRSIKFLWANKKNIHKGLPRLFFFNHLHCSFTAAGGEAAASCDMSPEDTHSRGTSPPVRCSNTACQTAAAAAASARSARADPAEAEAETRERQSVCGTRERKTVCDAFENLLIPQRRCDQSNFYGQIKKTSIKGYNYLFFSQCEQHAL